MFGYIRPQASKSHRWFSVSSNLRVFKGSPKASSSQPTFAETMNGGKMPAAASVCEDEDNDSVESWRSTAESLASTASDLVIELGRRFPSYRYGSSPFPRGDKLAQENEVALHNILLRLFDDRLHAHVVGEPRNVLDIRCGQQGLWAKGMADAYPDCQVTGMDVLAPSGTEGRQNLEFQLQSFCDETWVLDDVTNVFGNFDFIMARSIFGSSRDYPQVYKQCYEHLEPGGYFQQIEIDPHPNCDDGTLRENSVIVQICNLIPLLERSFNTDYHLAYHTTKLLEDAGFVEIKQESYYTPWSPWHPEGTKEHEVGRYTQRLYETGLQGWILVPLVKHYNFTPEQIDKICEAAIIEIQRNDQHLYSSYISVTARKPLTAAA